MFGPTGIRYQLQQLEMVPTSPNVSLLGSEMPAYLQLMQFYLNHDYKKMPRGVRAF